MATRVLMDIKNILRRLTYCMLYLMGKTALMSMAVKSMKLINLFT